MTCPLCQVSTGFTYKMKCGEMVESHPMKGEYVVCSSCSALFIYESPTELRTPTHTEIQRFLFLVDTSIEEEKYAAQAQWN